MWLPLNPGLYAHISTTVIHRPLCVCVSMGSYKESMKESFLTRKKEIHQLKITQNNTLWSHTTFSLCSSWT